MAVNSETTRSRELRPDRVLVPPGRLVLGMLGMLGMGVLVVLSWFVTAIAHADDGYAVDHV